VTVPQPVKKFLGISGMKRLITIFARAWPLTALSQFNEVRVSDVRQNVVYGLSDTVLLLLILTKA
jgi:hypothetical protein